MNVPIVGRIYHIVDKTTNGVIKVGSTTRTVKQRFGQSDYKKRYLNHFIREVKIIRSSEFDSFDPADAYCPFLWHLVAAEHLEILKQNTFKIDSLSNLCSPLDQKFFSRFGVSALSSVGGRLGGRAHVKSGHLRSISSKGGKAGGSRNGHINGLALFKAGKGLFKPGVAASGGRKGGPASGRKAVESGQLDSLRTVEHQRNASKYANHNRWHINRGVMNLQCVLCREATNGTTAPEHPRPLENATQC